MPVSERIEALEKLFLGGPIKSNGLSLSIETLIDVLIVLYDECSNSSLRKEKTMSNFIQFGMYEFCNLIIKSALLLCKALT